MNRNVTGVNEDFRFFRAAEMVNDSGTLIRPLPARIFSGQDVLEVSGCYLVWRQTDSPFVISMAYKELSGTEDILLQFAKLHNGDPQSIFTFACKWGVLGICKHGLPASHNPYLLAELRSDPFCEPFKLGARHAEPLVYWQHYSAQARSLLRIAARLHLGKSGLKKDWDRVFELEPLDCRPDYGTDVNEDKLRLTLIVNRWIELGNVRPRFKWWNDEIRVSYDCTLFGILASQLMNVISRGKRVAACYSCGDPFTPTRQPKKEQRSFCQRCGRKASCRYAQRDCRRRKRADVSLKIRSSFTSD